MILVLLKNGRQIGPADSLSGMGLNRTFQATTEGAGAVAAKVTIEVSNDRRAWLALGTLNPSGTDMATDGFPSRAQWEFIRANVAELSAGAGVTVTMGYC